MWQASVIAEINQAKEPMAPVQAVIPNAPDPEAERMIVMMNKSFPSYVGMFWRIKVVLLSW